MSSFGKTYYYVKENNKLLLENFDAVDPKIISSVINILGLQYRVLSVYRCLEYTRVDLLEIV